MTAAGGALAPYRVLDLTGPLAPLAGKMLADLGADVVRVEPPEGSALRRRPPFADGVADPERGLAWWAYAAGTRSVALDLARRRVAAPFSRSCARLISCSSRCR